jgi:hypothetical protein
MYCVRTSPDGFSQIPVDQLLKVLRKIAMLPPIMPFSDIRNAQHSPALLTHCCFASRAVTIHKGADSKQNELQGWNASARNQKHREQN